MDEETRQDAAEIQEPTGQTEEAPAPAPAEHAEPTAEAEAPPAFDWTAVPWDQLPDEALPKIPALEKRANSIGAKRAQGIIDAERRKAEEAAAARRAEEEEQYLASLSAKLTDENGDPIEAATEAKKVIDGILGARRNERERLSAESARARHYAEASAQSVQQASRDAALRIQARLDGLSLPKAEQDAVWAAVEGRTLNSVAEVIAATEEALGLAYDRHLAREIQAKAQPVKEQAELSARAAVAARTRVDPSQGEPGPSAAQMNYRKAMAADDREFDQYWEQFKRGGFQLTA